MTSAHRAVATPGDRGEPAIEAAFERLVDEGENRLHRPLLSLISTGFLGGVDVGFGVLAYLVIEHQTGSRLLAALGFTIGFIALLLASSELFTENFLVPVAATLAKAGTISDLLRLWVVSLVMNLLGGFAMAAMIMAALPDLDATAAKAGSYYAHLGVQIVAAVVMPFVLVGSQLFHSVLDSLLMFAGLFSGQADYGYGDYAVALAWSTFGNLVGGLVLVTATRVLRVPHRVAEERDKRS